jgi:hypothetical protein
MLQGHFGAPQQQIGSFDGIRASRAIEKVFFKAIALRLRKLSEHVQCSPISFYGFLMT